MYEVVCTNTSIGDGFDKELLYVSRNVLPYIGDKVLLTYTISKMWAKTLYKEFFIAGEFRFLSKVCIFVTL